MKIKVDFDTEQDKFDTEVQGTTRELIAGSVSMVGSVLKEMIRKAPKSCKNDVYELIKGDLFILINDLKKEVEVDG